ncbi:MAG: phosphopantothenoylcysteine decarboxylase [Planctomycetes bacterium]|nr:phosphopantothenoylcysteine decarboxylase [Planctomycetota bacterium]
MKGKRVVLGVTGSIAAYKAADLVSQLGKEGADVTVILTRAAQEFVRPLTFHTLSRNPVVTDLFGERATWDPEHVALATRCDVFCVAPATANAIARLALGLADDALTTTALLIRCPRLVAPAMNDRMWEHETVQGHLTTLRVRGWTVIPPAEGVLACGSVGVGKLASVEAVFDAIARAAGPRA